MPAGLPRLFGAEAGGGDQVLQEAAAEAGHIIEQARKRQVSLSPIAGIVQELFWESELSAASGFIVRHPRTGIPLLVTAGHIFEGDPFSLILGRTSFVAGVPEESILAGIGRDRLIAHYPPEKGDVAVFDLSGLALPGAKILAVNSEAGTRNPRVKNYAFTGDFSDLAVRSCRFVRLRKDYGNGIQLAEFSCDVPPKLRNLLTHRIEASGSSGSPVVEEDTLNAVGLVRGGFMDSNERTDITSVGVAVFDLEKILPGR